MMLNGSVFPPNGISYRGSYFKRRGGSRRVTWLWDTHPSQYLIAPQIYHHIVIHQCFVDRKPEPRWVKHLKHLTREDEVWWLRISSEFDAMRSLTSQHLWVWRVGDDDMMFDGWLPKSKLKKVDTLGCTRVTHVVHHLTFQFHLYVDCWIFWKAYFWWVWFFFHDSKLQKHESIGWIFGETPRHLPSRIVTCLLPCAARDLKSSQCAVTQRKAMRQGKYSDLLSNFVFLIFDAWVTIVL